MKVSLDRLSIVFRGGYQQILRLPQIYCEEIINSFAEWSKGSKEQGTYYLEIVDPHSHLLVLNFHDIVLMHRLEQYEEPRT